MSNPRVEYESFDPENYEILTNLPEHIKALYKRVAKLEKIARVHSTDPATAPETEPVEHSEYVHVYLEGHFYCKVEHTGDTKSVHSKTEDIAILWGRPTVKTASQSIRYASCNIDSQRVTIAHITSSDFSSLKIYPCSVWVAQNKGSGINGKYLLRLRVNRIITLLESAGWRISSPEQRGNIVIARPMEKSGGL